MTRRRIHVAQSGERTARVYWDSDWQEYRVRLYVNGALRAAADYFTDCKTDAIDTAEAMVAV